MSLRPHKRVSGEPAVRKVWCEGGGQIVPVSQSAMVKWAARRG